mgnify:FL=1
MENTKGLSSVEKIFGPDGVIAKYHEAYEYRPSQIEMAAAVGEALAQKKHLIVEAGTGTGKTLAYLIPAIAASLAKNERIIVSTGTKNLQEQLMQKDIPFLQKILPKSFKVVYMKGRSNYVCLHRLKKVKNQAILENIGEMDYFSKISKWAYKSETGDIAELEIPEGLSFWRHINARHEICLGHNCPDFEDCFITKMRKEAEKANVVIVNHHLFFANLASQDNRYGKVLPDYTTVIFDEAHLIEDVVTTLFGLQISNHYLEELILDSAFLEITNVELNRDITKLITRLAKSSQNFWEKLADALGEETKISLPKNMFFDGAKNPTPLGQAYIALRSDLETLEDRLSNLENLSGDLETYLHRTNQIRVNLDIICLRLEDDRVYWAEKLNNRSIFLNASPIDISELLQEKLLDTTCVVLTSATLSSDNNFEYIKQRIGLNKYETSELLISSGFDYQKQTILYLPANMPDPRSDDYLLSSAEQIIRLLKITQGRAFVLCTSIQSMHALYELVKPQVDFPCLIQGSLMKSSLLEKFKTTPNAVLFAVSSFWQGVDVRGNQLSCVIIDKLPFAVPTDPLVEARTDLIRKRGGNPFYDYFVPQAIITLKQGIGRLIRSKTDFGIIAILDPRIRTKAYGQKFLASLPNMKITGKLEDVKEFFQQTKLCQDSTR